MKNFHVFHAKDEYYFDAEGCFISEILNTDNFDPFSVALARLPPGGQTSPHALQHSHEAYFILRGEAELPDGEGGWISLGKGQVVLFERGCPQSIRNRGEGDLEILCICSPRFTDDQYTSL